MKRSSSLTDPILRSPSSDGGADDQKMKKAKTDEEEEEEKKEPEATGFGQLDNNLLFEVFRHADARTLAAASCVSKQWHDTAQDERLWELICTRHWANIGCGNRQLRSVVLALGGFRRLHALYIWPLQKPSSSSSSAAAVKAFPQPPTAAITKAPAAAAAARWGKDEVNLSLSLLSIRFYEKMNYSNRPPPTNR